MVLCLEGKNTLLSPFRKKHKKGNKTSDAWSIRHDSNQSDITYEISILIGATNLRSRWVWCVCVCCARSRLKNRLNFRGEPEIGTFHKSSSIMPCECCVDGTTHNGITRGEISGNDSLADWLTDWRGNDNAHLPSQSHSSLPRISRKRASGIFSRRCACYEKRGAAKSFPKMVRR